MSEKGFYTGKWSIREDGAIVSEVGGYEIFGAHGIADMVAYWQSLGLKHSTVSNDLFYQFVHESLKMAVSPQPYTHEGKLRYMGFDVFQEKDGGEDKAIVDSPAPDVWREKNMSEYKENTVGWWLSQLKEPLRSSVLRMVSKYKNDAQLDCFSMVEATKWLYELMLNNASGYATFCNGIYGFFLGNVFRGLGYELQLRNGWELAKQCAHDAADFPPPTELGENEDLTITFPAAVDNRTDKRLSMMSVEELLALPRKEIPEPAVIGYELPKPIDTIEKKHELRIKNLEAQVKDMAGEMENLIIQVRALNRQVFNTHLD